MIVVNFSSSSNFCHSSTKRDCIMLLSFASFALSGNFRKNEHNLSRLIPKRLIEKRIVKMLPSTLTLCSWRIFFVTLIVRQTLSLETIEREEKVTKGLHCWPCLTACRWALYTELRTNYLLKKKITKVFWKIYNLFKVCLLKIYSRMLELSQ